MVGRLGFVIISPSYSGSTLSTNTQSSKTPSPLHRPPNPSLSLTSASHAEATHLVA